MPPLGLARPSRVAVYNSFSFSTIMSDPRTESERRTRQARIDPKLRAWGWRIVPFDPAKSLAAYTAHALTEFPTAHGPADYALVVEGQLLGMVEAKKVTLGPQNVLTQAER